MAADNTEKSGAGASITITSKVKTRAPRDDDHPPAEWHFAPANPDPLATTIAACMALGGRDVGVETLLAGVPLAAGNRLTPALGLTAAEGLGFRAKLVCYALKDLPDAVLPAVLFLSDRKACVLARRLGADGYSIIDTERGTDPITVPSAELDEKYSGHVLLLREAPSPHDTTGTSKPDANRHWYWGAARRHWPEYFQVIIASMLVNLLALAMPIFTMNVYDRVFPNAALITLWSLVAGVGIAIVFDALLKWVRSSVVDRVGRQVDQSVSSEIFRHIANLRLDAPTMPSGAMMNNLKDYEQVRDFFSSQTVATITDLAFSGVFIAVIWYLGGPLAYPPMIALVFVLVVGLLILWPLRRASNAARQTTGVKNAVAVEAVTELETLKAISGQGRMQSRWERQVAESATAQERSRGLATLATTLTGMALQMSSIGIVILGVYLAMEGTITMGAVIAAMILSGRALAPGAALSGLFVRGSFAFSTLKSLDGVMASPSDKSTSAAKLNAHIEKGVIDLKSVSLTYANSETPALEKLTFQAQENCRLGLIGAVGAGKTSLVRVIAGFYAPTEGMVMLDGLNITQLSPANLRRDVQLVPQEAVLFSGTLAENIAFGVPHARSEDILAAARTAGVDQIAARHPQGFSMPIEERGRNLSGGQRQMVALARALLPRPKVLILDEPTSSMDTQSEKLFIARLKHALAQRPFSLIVATHRMALLDLVDDLVLLDQGRVVSKGPKAEVLKSLAKNQQAAPK